MIFKDINSKKIFVKVATYSSVYIFGPLIFFAIAGFALDEILNASPKFLLSGIGIAFVFSNILLFKKRAFLSKNIKNEVDKITRS